MKEAHNQSRLKMIYLAAPRGYCAGVERAVLAVERALKIYGLPVFVRRQIIHNRFAVERLAALGAVFVEELDSVPQGSTVVFSAHGVAPLVHEQAAQLHLKVIDATCPLVTKVHLEARRFIRDGYKVHLIGHAGHDEVDGILGESPGDITLIQTVDDAQTVQATGDAVWLSQTTLSVDDTSDIVEALRTQLPQIVDPPSDDICFATQNRQAAVKKIASLSDIVIIVGSQNSSNSRRLTEVANASGRGNAHLVEDATAIKDAWFHDIHTIGVSSGASTPGDLVDGLLVELAARGWHDVELIETHQETIEFSLPPGLRTVQSSTLPLEDDGRLIEL